MMGCMEAEDRARIQKIIRDRRLAHEALRTAGSPTYRAFLDMEEAAFRDGRLDKRSKELVAFGISVVIDCESCMQWHLSQAQKAGASREQVLEALEVALEMGGGPATVAARFALKALEYHFGPPGPAGR